MQIKGRIRSVVKNQATKLILYANGFISKFFSHLRNK